MIRPLEKTADFAAVLEFYTDAPDYWEEAEGFRPDRDKVSEFFDENLPNCDPDETRRLGLFIDERLSGIADLFFGFPSKSDAYVGLMLLGPWARNKGLGQDFLRHIESVARSKKSEKLYLAVMKTNPKGRAFWEREGFSTTGLSGVVTMGSRQQELHRLVKAL